MAHNGFRVLATGVRTDADQTGFDVDSVAGQLTLTGLHAMLDPPRDAARTAVAACHSAGIDVKMITGDHAGTAAAIATSTKKNAAA